MMRLFTLNTLGTISDTVDLFLPASPLKTDGYKTSMPGEVVMWHDSYEDAADPTFGTLIQMISSDEILTRLNEIVRLEGYMASKLYPRLAKLGGQELYPRGVAIGIALAVYDATQGLPPVLQKVLSVSYPEIVEALVLDEPLHPEILDILGVLNA